MGLYYTQAVVALDVVMDTLLPGRYPLASLVQYRRHLNAQETAIVLVFGRHVIQIVLTRDLLSPSIRVVTVLLVQPSMVRLPHVLQEMICALVYVNLIPIVEIMEHALKRHPLSLRRVCAKTDTVGASVLVHLAA